MNDNIKAPRIANAISHIDDGIVKDAMQSSRKLPILRLGTVAACFLLAIISVVLLPMIFEEESVPPTGDELLFEKHYDYSVDGTSFSDYIGGKVISEEKIDTKIADVTVSAGWKNGAGEWISTEKLRAEVYSIKGVEEDIAVALKFIDKGEALTTTHFYVIIAPEADHSQIEEYMIAPIDTQSGSEIAE